MTSSTPSSLASRPQIRARAGQRVQRTLRRYEPVLAFIALALLIVNVASAVRGDAPGPLRPLVASPLVPGRTSQVDALPPVVPTAPAASMLTPGLPSTAGAAGRSATVDAPATPSTVSTVVSFEAAAVDVAVAPSGRIWVSTVDGDDGAVVSVDPNGRMDRVVALPPGAGAGGLAVGPDDNLRIALPGSAKVLTLEAASGRTIDTLDIPDVATPCVPPLIAGSCDGGAGARPRPTDVAVGRDGALYVSDADQAALWRLPPGGDAVEQLAVSSAWRDILRDSGPGQLVVEGGRVVFVVRSPSGAGGLLLRLPSDGSGSAEELYRTAGGIVPAGVVQRDGASLLALSSGEVVAVRGGQATVVVESLAGVTPAGITFSSGGLFLAGVAPDGRGIVLRLPV